MVANGEEFAKGVVADFTDCTDCTLPKTPDDVGADKYMWTVLTLSDSASRGLQMGGWTITVKSERLMGYPEGVCYFARCPKEQSSWA
jgi:hypothetical protein